MARGRFDEKVQVGVRTEVLAGDRPESEDAPKVVSARQFAKPPLAGGRERRVQTADLRCIEVALPGAIGERGSTEPARTRMFSARRLTETSSRSRARMSSFLANSITVAGWNCARISIASRRRASSDGSANLRNTKRAPASSKPQNSTAGFARARTVSARSCSSRMLTHQPPVRKWWVGKFESVQARARARSAAPRPGPRAGREQAAPLGARARRWGM